MVDIESSTDVPAKQLPELYLTMQKTKVHELKTCQGEVRTPERTTMQGTAALCNDVYTATAQIIV